MTQAEQAALSDALELEFGLDIATLGPGALGHALKALGAAQESKLLGPARRDSAEQLALLEQFLVQETWFFREAGAFDLLKQFASLPRPRPFRALCLPCASGEETWSIAIALRAAGLNSESARVIGVDVSPSALDAARAGHYRPKALRGKPLENWPDDLLADPDGGFRVADRLRGMVVFQRGNAMDARFLRDIGPFDAVFCRNLMIYMSASGRARLCRSFGEILAEDGLLFLGHAETLPEGSGWSRHGESAAFAWRRTRKPAPIPQTPPLEAHTPPSVRRVPPDLRASRAPRAGRSSLARDLANQGAYGEASRLLRRELSASPLDPDLHALQGILHDIQGQQELAIRHLRRALYLAPDHAESLAHLALLQEQRGNRAEAERLRRRLKRAAPPRP